ncbi:hypothetical protein AAC387_Pa09g0114 [Persea americana]
MAEDSQLEQIQGKIQDYFRAIANGFQKLDKIKDPNRQSKQLEELTGKMRECKQLIKEFDHEIKDAESGNPPEVNKELNDKKQSMIKELNSYVALRKTYTSSLGNKRVELLDAGAGSSEPTAEDNVQMASTMSNQELINSGMKAMDETDQAIERSKQVVEKTIEVGAQTAVTLKGQTEQMGRVVNELDTIHFSIKKASQLVKEIGRQVATDKCIMAFLFLIVCGVIAIIVVKVVNPNNKDIRDIPGRFVIGGPHGDAGLTSRKIIIDTYGGRGPHGGGAFSGKDSTKVDGSGACTVRQAAKSIVASGLARRCIVQLSYAIGVPEPLSVLLDSYGFR